MSRKKPEPVKKPFFTNRPYLAKLVQGSPLSPETNGGAVDLEEPSSEPLPPLRSWLDEEDDAIIDTFPHLREYVKTFGDKPTLMTHRPRAKAASGLLSKDQFLEKLAAAKIPQLLIRYGAWSDPTAALAKNIRASTFCTAELYLLYVKHRETPADELLRRFSTADGRNSLLVLADQIDGLTKNLRWAVQLSECFLEFPMPDEMWRGVMSAAGKAGDTPPGELRWFAVWLREASAHLSRAGGNPGIPKRSAFQQEWRVMATQKTGRQLWDVAFALFRLIAPASPDSLEAFTLAARRRKNTAAVAARPKKPTGPKKTTRR